VLHSSVETDCVPRDRATDSAIAVEGLRSCLSLSSYSRYCSNRWPCRQRFSIGVGKPGLEDPRIQYVVSARRQFFPLSGQWGAVAGGPFQARKPRGSVLTLTARFRLGCGEGKDIPKCPAPVFAGRPDGRGTYKLWYHGFQISGSGEKSIPSGRSSRGSVSLLGKAPPLPRKVPRFSRLLTA